LWRLTLKAGKKISRQYCEPLYRFPDKSGVDANDEVLALYTPHMEPKPGELVVLIEVPRGFLDDLPQEDQQAINEIVGKPIALNEYDDAGRAELEFRDRNGNIHFIFVDPKFIRRI